MTHPFEPTELDWHLIVDHGVDTRLIANNRALFRERGEDEEYHEFAELNHQIMHNIPTKQNPHTQQQSAQPKRDDERTREIINIIMQRTNEQIHEIKREMDEYREERRRQDG